MASYVSVATIASKVEPGAKIVVRKISEGRRLKLKKLLAPLADTVAINEAKVERLRADLGFHEEMTRQDGLDLYAGLDPDVRKNFDAIADEYKAALDCLNRAYADFGFVRTEDFELDGNASPTLEQIVADGSPDFYLEITVVVKMQFEMTAEQRENFASLSTSGAAEDGKAKSTTAENVENEATT